MDTLVQIKNPIAEAKRYLLRDLDDLEKGKIKVEKIFSMVRVDKDYALATLDDIKIAGIKSRDGNWAVALEAVCSHKEAAEKVLEDKNRLGLQDIESDDGFNAGDMAMDTLGLDR